MAVRGVDDQHVRPRGDQPRCARQAVLARAVAPRRAAPKSSLQVRKARRLLESLTVIRPRSFPMSSTISSFSIRLACRILLPPRARCGMEPVMSLSLVITSAIAIEPLLEAERRIGEDPTRRPFWVHRRQEIRSAHHVERFGDLQIRGVVTGSRIMPLSDFFTFSTSSACSSIERLRCTTPMPPLRHRDRHRRFGHRVHRRTEQRGCAARHAATPGS